MWEEKCGFFFLYIVKHPQLTDAKKIIALHRKGVGGFRTKKRDMTIIS